MNGEIVRIQWTPAQALAVFDVIDALRDQLLDLNGPQIQLAIRNDRLTSSSKPGRAITIKQRDLPF